MFRRDQMKFLDPEFSFEFVTLKAMNSLFSDQFLPKLIRL